MGKEENDELLASVKEAGTGIHWVEITHKNGWKNEAAGIHYPKGFIVSVLAYKVPELVDGGIGKLREDITEAPEQKVNHTKI